MLLEIFGLVGLYYLQVQQTKTVSSFLELISEGSFQTNLLKVWVVPQRYLCTFGADVQNYACSQDKEVPCWVSRPWEKTIFLLYMLSMGLVAIIVIMVGILFFSLLKIVLLARLGIHFEQNHDQAASSKKTEKSSSGSDD